MDINGYLTSKIEPKKGDCIPCVAHEVVGWKSSIVETTAGIEWLGTTAANGYSHKMFK